MGDILRKLLEDGLAYKRGHEYFGIATDGVEVYLGNDTDWGNTNSYLESHPTPDTW